MSQGRIEALYLGGETGGGDVGAILQGREVLEGEGAFLGGIGMLPKEFLETTRGRVLRGFGFMGEQGFWGWGLEAGEFMGIMGIMGKLPGGECEK